MNEPRIDDAIRRMQASISRATPTPPAQIELGQRRRPTNRMRTAGMAAGGLCLLTAFGVWSVSRANHSSSVVPASEFSSGITVPVTNAQATVSPQKVTACDGSALSAVAEFRGLLAGNTKVQVVLTNVGEVPCVLTGSPTIEGVDSSGNTRSLSAVEGTYFGDPAPLADGVLQPGGEGAFYLAGALSCDAASRGQHETWAAFRAVLPGDSLVEFKSDFDSACGVSVSQFGMADPPTPPDGA